MSSSTSSAASICSCSTETAPPFYLDEKWKLSKKESSRSLSSNSSSFVNKKNSSTHHKKCTFARKCARLVKEQRARFYTMRRCVVMLICWNDHYSDS